MIYIPKTARGLAKPATPEEIEKEESRYFLATDLGLIMITDNEIPLIPNTGDFGYTHPNLHRRIDNEAPIPAGYGAPFVYYDSQGNPYPQRIVLGVWDGINSYRTTEIITHDEESTTCEIP